METTFRPVDYMEWAKSLSLAKGIWNLSASGVFPAPIDPGDLGPVEDWFRLQGANAYGFPPLLEEIARRYGVTTDQVLLASGTSMANYLIFAASIRPGDRVLIEEPRYEPLERAAEAVGAEVTRIPLDGADGIPGFLDRALPLLAGGTVRAVVITNLQNPTGRLWEESELKTLARACEEGGAVLLADEVYLEALDPPRRPAACISGAAVSTSSLTKVYGLGSLRVGWAVGPAPLITRARQANDSIAVVGPYCTEYLAWVLLSDPGRWKILSQRAHSQIQTNRELVQQFLKEQPQISMPMPIAGTVGLGVLKTAEGSADPWLEKLRTDFGVVLTPGRFFLRPDHFRIAWGGPSEEVREGLLRFGEFLDQGGIG